MKKHTIKLMRVYNFDHSVPGARYLIDKVWPRGIAKKNLEPFYWAKEITPSTDLRKWFNHQPERFTQFKEKYLQELDGNQDGDEFVNKVNDSLKEQDVLLLYGAKDPENNHAIILKDWLDKKIK